MIGYLVQDNDCHWYFIPQRERANFYALLEQIDNWSPLTDSQDTYYRLDAEFINSYSEYRINNPSDILFKKL